MINSATSNNYTASTGDFDHDRFEKENPPYNWQIVQNAAKGAFTDFKKIVWKQVDSTQKTLSSTLKVVKEVKPALKAKLDGVIAYLGVLSLVNLILALDGVHDKILSAIKHFNIRDVEGFILTITQLMATPVELLDELIKFVKALTAFNAIPTIAFFSMIAIPIALIGLSYGVAKGVYDLTRFSIEVYDMPKHVSSDKDLIKLKTYLNNKVGSDKKEHIMRRRTDGMIVNIMNAVQKHLDGGNVDTSKINIALKDMRTVSARKLTLNAVGILGNVAMLAAIVATISMPLISVLVIPSVALGRAIFKLAQLHIEQFLVYKGLHNVTWHQS